MLQGRIAVKSKEKREFYVGKLNKASFKEKTEKERKE